MAVPVAVCPRSWGCNDDQGKYMGMGAWPCNRCSNMMPVDVEGSKQELAVEALEGDVILKLLLVRHFKHAQPNITRQQLH